MQMYRILRTLSHCCSQGFSESPSATSQDCTKHKHEGVGQCRCFEFEDLSHPANRAHLWFTDRESLGRDISWRLGLMGQNPRALRCFGFVVSGMGGKLLPNLHLKLANPRYSEP